MEENRVKLVDNVFRSLNNLDANRMGWDFKFETTPIIHLDLSNLGLDATSMIHQI